MRAAAFRQVGLTGVLALGLVAGVGPIATAGAATSVIACTYKTDQNLRTNADVVFKGVLDGAISSASKDRDGKVHESGVIRQFTPSEVYKGEVDGPQFVVEPPDSGATADVDWDGKGPYLVFAKHPSKSEQKKYDLAKDDLLFQKCSGTRQIDADDQPDFGPGEPVTKAEPETAPPLPPAPPTEEPSGGPNDEDGGFNPLQLSSLGELLRDLLDGLLTVPRA